MNWDDIEGQWKVMKGKVKEQWGDLTDDEIDTIGGKKDQLIGRIQKRYGMAREDAARQVEEFERRVTADGSARA
ncbi:MAG TPA: CsbD family protein [Gemmatimonadaceae bacterium]|nr:CsbD family protein [Gemmatimonadaceae bacterium]